MKKTLLVVVAWLSIGWPTGRSSAELVTISAVDILSYDLQGAIPPNETRSIDVGSLLGSSGAPYHVVGLGWDLTLDAFVPSWLSDAAISFGSDPTFQTNAFVLAPGQGFDYPALQTFSSGGIRDLTNWNGTGQDYSFEIPSGNLYLEFFELYDDFSSLPDAWYIAPSTITLDVVPIPEPSGIVMVPLAAIALLSRRRALRSQGADRPTPRVRPTEPWRGQRAWIRVTAPGHDRPN